MSDSTPDNVTPIGEAPSVAGETISSDPIPFGDGDDFERELIAEVERRNVEARADFRRRMIEGLRELADLYEGRPELPFPEETYVSAAAPDGYGLSAIVVPTSYYGSDAGEKLAAAAKALGKAEKSVDDVNMKVIRKLGGGAVELRFTAPREQVCTRRVVGTETVERPVYSTPAAPEVIGTETVERELVEWECEPLLSKGGES